MLIKIAKRKSRIKVWGRQNSFNVQKVLWTLDELRLPYEHIVVGGMAGGLDAPLFLAMNPHGRIPVLRDKDCIVWESHTIVRYLAATYGPGTLWATSPATRSLADRWMDWTLATLQPELVMLFKLVYRAPGEQQDQETINAAADRCARAFGILDVHLAAHDHVAGARFTMGDIPAGSTLHRYFEMGAYTPSLPHVRAWYERLAARPAYHKNVMVSFEALRGVPVSASPA